MMDELETRLRTAYQSRAASAPRELHRDLPTGREQNSSGKRIGGPRRLAPVAVVVAVLALVAAAVVATRLIDDSDKPSPASDGIMLNTSSWDPNAENAYWMQAEIRGVVRVDANGCVYLGTPDRPNWAQNVYWPAGYAASREADGTVTISDPDGVIVAATGQQLSVGGGHPLDYPELACSAEGSQSSVMITDVLPPLSK